MGHAHGRAACHSHTEAAGRQLVSAGAHRQHECKAGCRGICRLPAQGRSSSEASGACERIAQLQHSQVCQQRQLRSAQPKLQRRHAQQQPSNVCMSCASGQRLLEARNAKVQRVRKWRSWLGITAQLLVQERQGRVPQCHAEQSCNSLQQHRILGMTCNNVLSSLAHGCSQHVCPLRVPGGRHQNASSQSG